MNQIVKYMCEPLNSASINCIIEHDEPWFKAIDVAKALKYTDTNQAIRIHVSEDDKRTQGSFNLNPVLTTGLHGNWKIAKYINESGLYCLIFGSDMEEAKVFKYWVTREVLPQIRKTGSYKNDYYYWRNYEMQWSEVNELARGREDELHYRMVKHIKMKYPDAITIGGLGEHTQTHHARADATNKGYIGGQPDVTILRGLPNGFQDVLAIELKNPNGKYELSENKNLIIQI